MFSLFRKKTLSASEIERLAVPAARFIENQIGAGMGFSENAENATTAPLVRNGFLPGYILGFVGANALHYCREKNLPEERLPLEGRRAAFRAIELIHGTDGLAQFKILLEDFSRREAEEYRRGSQAGREDSRRVIEGDSDAGLLMAEIIAINSSVDWPMA